jgi:hypothetical protein
MTQTRHSTVGGMKAAALPFVLLAALLVAGCAASPEPVIEREVRDSLPYSITVRPTAPAVVTADGFRAELEFEVVSPYDLRRNSLVQELRQEVLIEYRNGRVERRAMTLVEAFLLRLAYVDAAGLSHYRLLAGQRDNHSLYGLGEGLAPQVVRVSVRRDVFAYVANVYDADFTRSGFAHLPHNQDGSVVTNAPPTFNRHYQQRYQTMGRVTDSGDSLGIVYRFEYELRPNEGETSFIVSKHSGQGQVIAPDVIWR